MANTLRKNVIRKQLATAVRSIQWSYAILWSPSSEESGVFQFGDGYYNGDIKTRKTVSSVKSKANNQTAGSRSDQLRELYNFLLFGDNNNNQTWRPLDALSPENLTNVEWFYLICMSYEFNIGQGLPGRSLESGRTIWLSNAHGVDTGVFSRSLLAKTVVCLPLLGGVVELGVTELVEEDINVIQRIRAAFKNNNSSLHVRPQCPWRGVIKDDLLSNYVLTSTTNNNSSDCISQSAVVHSECALVTPPKCDDPDPPISKDLHYQNVLSSIFKECSDQRVFGSSSAGDNNLYKKSSFRSWIKGGMETEKPEFCVLVTPQKMLKKMLFEVPQMMRMHSAAQSVDLSKDEISCKLQEIPNTNHVLAERRRREKVNERISILRSLIPSITKADKMSILDDTIAYLKKLERRVVELESCDESIGRETKIKKRKEIDIEERTSYNYGDDISVGGVKNKRKTREVEEQGQECSERPSRDSLVVDNTIAVSIAEEEILINISCRWGETLLGQIIDAMSNLHLDSQSVHSSIVDGLISLKMQFKVKGSTSVSVGMITQSLQRVLGKN